jgi:hypothetical protein
MAYCSGQGTQRAEFRRNGAAGLGFYTSGGISLKLSPLVVAAPERHGAAMTNEYRRVTLPAAQAAVSVYWPQEALKK